MTESDGSKQPASPAPAIVWQRRLRTVAAHALGALGRTLISVGALLLLFVVYQLWGTGLHEARAQNSLSNEFEQLLHKMLAKNPKDRPATMGDVISRLRSTKIFKDELQAKAGDADGMG